MAAGVWNSEIEQGATWEKTFVYKGNDGAPIDIRGAEIRFQARDYPTAPDALLNCSVGSGITIVNDNSGTFVISVDATSTANIAIPSGSTSRRLVYDILLKLADSSVVYRILKGCLEVSPGVTR